MSPHTLERRLDLGPDWSARVTDRASRTEDRELRPFADALRLRIETLRAFDAFVHRGALAVPMRTASGRACGIRLRFSDGRKSSIRRSREALFVTSRRHAGRLILTEGLTDALVAFDVGLAGPEIGDVVGRPSCRGARLSTLAIARDRDVVLLVDADESGVAGGVECANSLVGVATSVRLVLPHPHKDLREMRDAGVTLVDFEERIAFAAKVEQAIAADDLTPRARR